MYSGADLCSPFFSNFSETLYEGWFSCKDFPGLMNEVFVFLDFSSTCGEQPFSHTKSEASEYEQLILASTPGKSQEIQEI